MCGRFAVFSEPGDLARLFDVDDVRTEPLPARYNIAPTLDVYAVVESAADSEATRRLGTLRWGLVPHWRDDPKAGPINARVETVAEKPMFREAFARRRCLIPADGFYEWPTRAAPHFVHREDGEPLAFAGLWETWRRGEEDVHTCAIVTRAAEAFLTSIHDRMPAMLPASSWGLWLRRDEDDTDLLRAVVDDAPLPESLTARPVSTAVNNVRNEGPDLLTPTATLPLPGGRG